MWITIAGIYLLAGFVLSAWVYDAYVIARREVSLLRATVETLAVAVVGAILWLPTIVVFIVAISYYINAMKKEDDARWS